MPAAMAEGSTPPDQQLSVLIGPWGLFQSLMFAYDCLAMLAMGAHNLLFVVMAPNDADYWCQRPADYALSDEQWKSASIPRDANGTYDRCTVYESGRNRHDGRVDNASFGPSVATPVPTPARSVVHCSAWDFNRTTGAGTILEEWSLVCENRWMTTYSAVVYMSGSFVGLVVAGLFSDRVGRRPVIFVASVILEASGLAVQSARSFYLFTALRFLVSCSVTTIFFVTFVLVIETVETGMRGFCGMFVEYGFAAATLLVLGIGRFRPSWRFAQLAVMLPTSLLLSCFVVVVESPLWLHATSRAKLARRAIAEIHHTNNLLFSASAACSRVRRGSRRRANRGSLGGPESTQRQTGTLSDAQIDQLSKSDGILRDVTAMDQLRILTSKELRIVNVGIIVAWFVGTMTFYGLALGFRSSALSNALVTVVVVAAPLVGYAGIEHLGRVPTLAAAQIICGAICFAHAARLTGYVVEPLFVEMTAWFWVNITLDIMFLYGVEAYPTTVRCLGYCLSAGIGRLGNVAAPIIMASVKEYGTDGPYMVMAFASVASGILTLYMPETLAKQLPETAKKKDLFKFTSTPKTSSRKSSRKGSQHDMALDWRMNSLISTNERLPDDTRATKEVLWSSPFNDDKSKVSQTEEEIDAMLLQSAVQRPAFLGPPRKTARKDEAVATGERDRPPPSEERPSEGLSQPGTSAPPASITANFVVPYGSEETGEGAATVPEEPVQPEFSSSTDKEQHRRSSKGSRSSSRRSRESLLGEAPPFSKYR